MRKKTGVPYMAHVMSVCALALEHGADDVDGAGAVDTAVLPGRADLPVGHVGVVPVLRGQVGVGERLPHLLGGRLDVGDVDVRRNGRGGLGHGIFLCSVSDGAQGCQSWRVVRRDPALPDLVDRGGIEVVQALPPPSYDDDEVGLRQQVEVLSRRLARHLEAAAELGERLPVLLAESVEEQAPGRVGQCLEHRVEDVLLCGHGPSMQVFTCILCSHIRVRPVHADKVFKALGDPTRRKLLDLLCEKNGQTLGQLCENLDMARQSATQHLGILVAANLVSTVRRGREKLHFINPVPLHEVYERWVRKFERQRLSLLHDLKKELEGE